jgi:nitrite reductase (NO-forming)
MLDVPPKFSTGVPIDGDAVTNLDPASAPTAAAPATTGDAAAAPSSPHTVRPATTGAIIGARTHDRGHAPRPAGGVFDWWEGLPTGLRRTATQVVTVVVTTLIVLQLAAAFGLVGGSRSAAPSAGAGATTSATSTITPAKAPAHPVYSAVPPAAPQGNIVDVHLVAKEGLIAIAPGVAYNAWTFNGTVPGPIIRVRQGQTIHFTLTNDSQMPHSIDFHAAQTPWNVNYQPVAPGKSFSFDWQANYPGVFMYHCGTPPVMVHMANGMYGAIIVDPSAGWAPAQEYVLVQSEFYAHLDSNGTYSVDGKKLMAATPDYVVFNGYANQYKDAPLTAKAGERIRLFVVNAGPSLFSAFHVIGGIFSDVYQDGNPANHTVGDQTVTIPPGGGAVLELTIPDAGTYPFLTHSFMGADLGALGLLTVTA